MKEKQEKNNDNSLNRDETSVRKAWKTPELRILPVPTRTQGGTGDINDQDDVFYKKS